MDLISITPHAKLIKALKEMSVFSQRSAIRLKRLSLPMVCSIRARSL